MRRDHAVGDGVAAMVVVVVIVGSIVKFTAVVMLMMFVARSRARRILQYYAAACQAAAHGIRRCFKLTFSSLRSAYETSILPAPRFTAGYPGTGTFCCQAFDAAMDFRELAW